VLVSLTVSEFNKLWICCYVWYMSIN